MGAEHEPETVWRAQELYCVDRLSFERVAELTGVASSTLRRWADAQHWREKREEIAQAESDIRVNQILARSKLLRELMQDGNAQTAFAFNALETLTMKRAELVASGKVESPATELAAREIRTQADVVLALQETIEARLKQLMTRKEALNLGAVKELMACSDFLSRYETASQTPGTEAARPLSVENTQALRELLGLS